MSDSTAMARKNSKSQRDHCLPLGLVAAGVYGLERLRLVGVRHGRSSSRARGAK